MTPQEKETIKKFLEENWQNVQSLPNIKSTNPDYPDLSHPQFVAGGDALYVFSNIVQRGQSVEEFVAAFKRNRDRVVNNTTHLYVNPSFRSAQVKAYNDIIQEIHKILVQLQYSTVEEHGLGALDEEETLLPEENNMTTDNTRFEQNFDRFFEQFKDAVTIGGTLLEEAEKWTEMLSDKGLRLLWEKLGDEPVFDYDAVMKMIEEGEYTLPIEGMTTDDMDSSFVIWERGTPRIEVWQWFDERFSEGLVEGTSMDGQRAKLLTSTPAAIAFVKESLRECDCSSQSEDDKAIEDLKYGNVESIENEYDEEPELTPQQTIDLANEAIEALRDSVDMGEDINDIIYDGLQLVIKKSQYEAKKPYVTMGDLVEGIQQGFIDPDPALIDAIPSHLFEMKTKESVKEAMTREYTTLEAIDASLEALNTPEVQATFATTIGKDFVLLIKTAFQCYREQIVEQEALDHAEKEQPYDAIEDLSNAIKSGLVDPGTLGVHYDAGEVRVIGENGEDVYRGGEYETGINLFSVCLGIEEYII